MTQTVTLAGVMLALFAVDAAGVKTTLPAGTPAWTVDDPTVATLTPSSDGLSAKLVGTGVAGTVNVTASVGGFTKTDSFAFAAAAPAPAPQPGPAVAIDWTVTSLDAGS